MPISVPDVLLGLLLPALAAALLLLGLRRAAWGPGAGAALAVGGGYVLAHLLQRGWRGFPPAEATDWPWPCAAAGALLGATALTRRGAAPLRVALRLLAGGATAWLVLAAWRRGVEADEARFTVGLLAAGAALAWSVLELRAARPGWFLPALLALTAAGAATAIGLSGSAKLALLAGGLCAVLTAAAVGAALRLAPPSLEGLVPPCVLALLALGLAAHFYSELPARSAQLLAAAPCTSWLLAVALRERGRGPLASALLLLPAAALLALAAALAHAASPSWDGVY
jgi:hypothetical protein